MKPLFIFCLVFTLVQSSCLGLGFSPEVENKKRFFVTDKDPNAKVPAAMMSRLQEGQQSACEALESLGGTAGEAGGEFGLLHEVYFKKGKIKAITNLKGSPLVRLSVGEKTPHTEEAFRDSVEAKCESGALSGFECFMGRTLSGVEWFRHGQINGQLNEAFPGIFSGAEDMKSSLLLSLVKKMVGYGIDDTADEDLRLDILLERMALFPASRSWKDWSEDVASSHGAVVHVLNNASLSFAEAQVERICGLSLWHRGFSQMLSLKGYVSPIWDENEDGSSSLKELSGKQKQFDLYDRLGAFYSPQTGKRLKLEAEDIANYDPSCHRFQPMAETPVDGVTRDLRELSRAGDLSDYLYLILGSIHSYDASHPGAPWFHAGQDYLLGDITQGDNRAVLPHEAHSLALGLVSMGFKNLADSHIVQINAEGKALEPGQDPRGVVLHEAGRVGLKEVSLFAEAVTRLSHVLKYFLQKSPDEWEELSPVYTEKTLADLMGEALFAPEQLRCLAEKYPSAAACSEELMEPREISCDLMTLAKEDNAQGPKAIEKKREDESLYAKLKALKLPLVMLMNRMAGETSQQCRASLNWNLETGEVLEGPACDAEDIALFRNTIRLMGHDNQSLALEKRAKTYR